MHETERNRTKQNETGPCKSLIKNDKFFIIPVKSNKDLKQLFLHMASIGAGRPVDHGGLPIGPWTPELLAHAISRLDPTGEGIELRTVQHWFQDSDKSISRKNLHWLARIFGCGDQEGTSAWLSELMTAQRRLITKRKSKGTSIVGGTEDVAEHMPLESFDGDTKITSDGYTNQLKPQISLARLSEAVFCGASLNLPTLVFAGAVALGLFSYFLNINAVTYDNAALGVIKQVGYLWAPNWTLLFIVFMPLFFLYVGELLCFWKNNSHLIMSPQGTPIESYKAWDRRVQASKYTLWVAFLMCFAFAGVLQWISIRLLPLMRGSGNYGTDWGSVALEQPEIISVHSSIIFTGMAYLYMSICFYLLIAGIILLNLIIDDFGEMLAASILKQEVDDSDTIYRYGVTILRGVFRCAVLIILIAMSMKLQSSYKTSSGSNILSWLFDDIASVFVSSAEAGVHAEYKSPNHFTSFAIVLLSLFVFTKGAVRIGTVNTFRWTLKMMVATIALLVVTYLLIGAFAGFSILLSVGVLLSIYALVNPDFCRKRYIYQGDS
jgi:hypothetical protein